MQSIRKGFEAVMAFVQVITFQNVRHLQPNRVGPSSSYLPRLWSSWQGPAGSLPLWCLPPVHPGCEAKVYKPLTWDKGEIVKRLLVFHNFTWGAPTSRSHTGWGQVTLEATPVHEWIACSPLGPQTLDPVVGGLRLCSDRHSDLIRISRNWFQPMAIAP